MSEREGRDEGALGRAFVRLADTMVEGYDVIDLCQDMVENCVGLLNPAAATISLRGDDSHLEVLASTSENSRLLSQFELKCRTGPCVEAYRTGEQMRAADLAADARRWPRFSRRVLAAGFTALYALPLRLRTERIGAMNLYCTERDTMSSTDLAFAQALADVATIGILHQRVLSETATVNGHLQIALDTRNMIELAKGILGGRHHLDPDTAFALLRAYARNTNQRLTVVAAAVVVGTADFAAILTPPDTPGKNTHP